MRVRKDGEETRRRILDAACQVFGEKGYRDARHSEICSRAGVNLAAINYHFGSKDELYRAVWRYIGEMVERLHPIAGGVSCEAPAVQRLEGIIRAFLARISDSRVGPFHAIRMAEFFNSTGLVDDLLAEQVGHWRRYTRGVVRELLGGEEEVPDSVLELCEMSVISQCRAVQMGRHPHIPCGLWRFDAGDLESLVRHITAFSLAGIAGVRAGLAGAVEDEV